MIAWDWPWRAVFEARLNGIMIACGRALEGIEEGIKWPEEKFQSPSLLEQATFWYCISTTL